HRSRVRSAGRQPAAVPGMGEEGRRPSPRLHDRRPAQEEEPRPRPPAERRGRGPRVADRARGYAEFRGTAEITTEGGEALIDELSLKYTGKKYAEFDRASAQDAERVVVRIVPRKVAGSL